LPVRFKRNAEIEEAPLESECILFSPSRNKFFVLNRTASFIWSQVREPATAEEVSGSLSKSFAGASASDIRSDVKAILDEMLDLAVVVAADPHDAAPSSSSTSGDAT